MAFFRRCLCCSKLIIVQPGLLERKKYCSKWCMDKYLRGQRRSPATEFKKGNRPQTWVPVGSEAVSKGYTRVKVAEPNVWRQKSHILWEEANKELLQEGWIVRHIDGDPLNDAPENLKAMPRSQHILETLKDPAIEKHTRKQVSKGNKRRWKRYREAREGHYDIFGLLEGYQTAFEKVGVMDISRPYLDEQAKIRTGSGTPSKALEGLPLFEETE